MWKPVESLLNNPCGLDVLWVWAALSTGRLHGYLPRKSANAVKPGHLDAALASLFFQSALTEPYSDLAT